MTIISLVLGMLFPSWQIAWIQNRESDNFIPSDEKNEWYRQLLEADLEKDPSNGRTVFYLANTYRDLGMWDKAIDMYLNKLKMPGQWIEEIVQSRFQLVKLYLAKKELHRAVEQANAIRSSGRLRPEPFYQLLRYYREAGDKAEAAKYLLLAQVC